jgi:hypothetical protein
MPSTEIVVPVNIRPETSAIQRIGNVRVVADGVEEIKITISEHVSFLHPSLVIFTCIVGISLSFFVFDAHENIEYFGSTLDECVLAIGLEEGEGNQWPRLVVSLGICRERISKLAESCTDIILLFNGSVTEGSGKLVELF